MQLDQQKELKSLWDDKAGWESEREQRNPRKQVHTDLLWREIRQSIGEDCRQKRLYRN